MNHRQSKQSLILKYLKRGLTLTPFEAAKKDYFDCQNLAVVIYRLRKKGIPIEERNATYSLKKPVRQQAPKVGGGDN